LLILAFPACNTTEQQPGLIKIPVSKPLPKKTELPAENYFNRLDLIPLETTPESLIGNIKKIFFSDNGIYIFDDRQNQVLRFNNKGKFISRIGNKGNGPGEYIQMQDFTIDKKNGDLLLLCDRPYKLLTFNSKGKFINDINIHNLYRSLIFTDNNLWLFPYDGNFLATKVHYTTGKISTSVLERNRISKKFSSFTHLSPYTTMGPYIYFFDQWDNRIYDFSGTVPKAKYFIDFGDKNLSFDNIKQKTSLKKITDYCTDNGYGFFISNFTESNRYIFFRYSPARFVIFDKESGESINFSCLFDQATTVYLSRLQAANGYKHCYIVNTLPPLHALLSKSYILKNASDQQMVEIIKNLKETDNPVLMKYILK
jgi:hypothetical protein